MPKWSQHRRIGTTAIEILNTFADGIRMLNNTWGYTLNWLNLRR